MNPLAIYEELRTQHEAERQALARRRSLLLRGLALTAAAIAWLTLSSLHGSSANWPLLLCFVAVVVLIVLALGVQTKLATQERLLSLYERSIARANGTQPQSGRTGIEPEQTLRPHGHLYERDLDLLGPDSLFGLLATVRTGLGERGLARYLLEPASHEETLARQQAVRELEPQTALRERIALLGSSKFQQITASFLDEWLAAEVPAFLPALRFVLAATALASVGLLFVGLTHVQPWAQVLPNLAIALGGQGLICLALRAKVMPLLAASVRLQGNVHLLSEGLALLQAETFVAPKLQHLQRLSLEPAGAVKELARLQQQLTIVEQRPKEYFLLFSLLLAAGTQAAMAMARWKRENAAAMRNWLDAWAEFEALNVLANYSFEHPQNCWPELLPLEHAPSLEATALAHPLLAGAVANNIELNATTRFLLISGSNMSGKSTMMRSIGINAVLAYAGASVCAQAMRLTPLTLGASLALTDSLAEGKSKFKAEVERLAAIVVASKAAPVLFLVDEIFSGTNSADRRTAAQAVLKSLLAHSAIGALSTHDLALTELATESNPGVNRHMASPDADDPLAFDYKLKPGVNTSSNALAIVRMMGLDA